MKPFVAYYRVSTERQGRSGLGIEAQRSAVARFAEAEELERIAEFTEVETGKGSDALDRRPNLTAALAAAKAAKCSVMVAKLDRLSRTADLRRNGADRRPLRGVIAPMLDRHPDRTLAHFRRKRSPT